MKISGTLLIMASIATSASAQTQAQIEKRYTRDYSGCILDQTIGRTIFLENYKG